MPLISTFRPFPALRHPLTHPSAPHRPMRSRSSERRSFASLALSRLALGGMLVCATALPVSAQESASRDSPVTALRVGGVIDGNQNERLGPHTIVVADGLITQILSGHGAVEADEIIDLTSSTLMPGFMDMHVHLLSESSPTTYLERFQLNPADLALKGTLYARRTLEAGFTTVRDLGGETTASLALRNAIDRGLVVGPRIFAATSSLATTGGHGDPSNGLSRALAWHPGPEHGVVNSPEAAREAVRQRYKEGADLIKITATGGVLSLAKNGQNPQFTIEEIRAITETADDYGFIVAAHVHGAEGIKRAVKGGVTSIEHGTFMDEEAFELMKEHGTWFVPTISAGKFVAEKAEIPGYFPEIIRPKAREIGPVIQETFGAAWKAGVKIAFGTDCGVCPHGSNAKEFGYMVDAGMPIMDAIQSATARTAELLRIDEEVGTIEVGKRADLVAVPGNPLDDVRLLEQVHFVMKQGTVFKHDAEGR